jgi:Mrp family chromosome partitioning ATPase
MQHEGLSIPCEGLVLRVFQQMTVKNDSKGSVVAVTSPQSGSGVSHIANALAEALRRDGAQSAISLCARRLSRSDSGHIPHTNLSNAIEAIRVEHRYALIDCGSMNTTQNAIRFAPLVDGIILVLEANRTQAEQIRYAEKTLEGVNGRILGHVLNKRTYVVPAWFYQMMDTFGF